MPSLALAPGDPRPSPKPQPIGNIPLILLFTTCGLCIIIVLWRKADTLRAVVAHQLQTWGPGLGDGRIRLSEDDGPAATEFLQDDYDEDHRGLEEDSGGGDGGEPLVRRAGGGVDSLPVPEEAQAFGRKDVSESESESESENESESESERNPLPRS